MRKGGDKRGSSKDRARRRERLLERFRANVDLRVDVAEDTTLVKTVPVLVLERYAVPLGTGVPVCRCYRCGRLMTVVVLTVDRIEAGGSYADRARNTRPACCPCNSSTGGSLGAARKAAARSSA